MTSDVERQRHTTVAQSIELFAGRAFDGPAADATVELRRGSIAYGRGDLATAARAVRAAYERQGATPIERCVAAELFTSALLRSADPELVRDDSETLPIVIPEPERLAAVEFLERAFKDLAETPVRGAISERLRLAEGMFRTQTIDLDWLEKAPLEDRDGEEQRSLRRAWKLAENGDVAAAQAVAPTTGHPWKDELLRADLLARAGDAGAALAIAERLRETYPARPHLERAFAGYCARLGRSDEALSATKIAAAALPGVGQLLHLAQMLSNRGLNNEAVAVLGPLHEDTRPNVLLVRARTLIHGERDFPTAERCYRRYLERKPNDHTVALELALALWNRHKWQEAATRAWTAFERSPEHLNSQELGLVGRIQLRVLPDDNTRADRVRRVVLELEKRRGTDPEAEAVRTGLLLKAGSTPNGVAPPDFESLVEHGAARSFPVEELQSMIQRQNSLAEAAATLYAQGQIGLLASLTLRNFRLAEYLERAIAARTAQTGLVCPPFQADEEPLDDVAGLELVITALELALLVRLGLLELLRGALGDDGRLLIPSDDWDQIVSDASESEEPQGARLCTRSADRVLPERAGSVV